MVKRTPLSIRNRYCGSTCCNFTFRYCFHMISSVIPHTCITKHVFSNQKCLLRFFIPIFMVLIAIGLFGFIHDVDLYV